MITSLRLVNFKNFADETLRVGPFTLIVGANASGKSNIRDAFRFLHGIGRGYTLAEIMGGKYGAGGQMEWVSIRGAPNEIVRMGPRPSILSSTFSVHIELDLKEGKTFYSITVEFNPRAPDGFRVLQEELRTESTIVYTTEAYRESTIWVLVGDNHRQVGLSRSQPVLTQFLQNYPEIWHQYVSQVGLSSALNNIRFLELTPERMREPSFPSKAPLGDSGQNLPKVLEEICAEPERRDILTAWLKELTPMDVTDFEFPRDPSGRVHLRIVERDGRRVSAYSASDGTLRFLGMLAALLGTDPTGGYFLEEIDNGIHPSRLWLLLELIEKQTARGGIQIVATTHSPGVLDAMNDTTFENSSVVYRNEESANAVIRPLAELYKAGELRKSQGLGRLHSGGWMETALAFTEAGNDEPETEE